MIMAYILNESVRKRERISLIFYPIQCDKCKNIINFSIFSTMIQPLFTDKLIYKLLCVTFSATSIQTPAK